MRKVELRMNEQNKYEIIKKLVRDFDSCRASDFKKR